jgi:hypothetical protein
MARMILRDAILSYPNLFQPRAAEEGGQAKYSAAFVFADTDALKEFKKAAIAVAQERWGDKLKGAKIKVLDTQHGPANFLVAGTLRIRLPWQDNAEVLANKGYPEGGAFINARSQSRPGIVSIVPDPKTGKPAAITDESAIYPGVIVNVSGDLFAYSNSGNNGISFGLGNVQIVRDGDRLDSRRNAADEFEADDTVADLSDLTDDVPAGVDEGDDLSDLIG